MICTYNGEAYLSKVFDAIYSQNRFEELVEEVILVDNASKDKTKEIVGVSTGNYEEERIHQIISSRCDPPVSVGYEEVELDGKNIVVITIPATISSTLVIWEPFSF